MTACHRLARTLLAAAALTLPIVASACAGKERTTATTQQVETAPLSSGEQATFEYVIPYGTGVKIDAGQTIDIMPNNIPAKVGDSIRIVNQDSRDIVVGPFFIGANKTLAMRFTREGTLSGTCDLNASGEITITVTA
ncbi:MAG: hypothetical protein KDB06_09645 [Ilumatobacter sp.]|nr:hypothetical protein [Ilumatobacter sp.]MCB0984897.1 hypothetical protein [Ilumatobacter sp.]